MGTDACKFFKIGIWKSGRETALEHNGRCECCCKEPAVVNLTIGCQEHRFCDECYDRMLKVQSEAQLYRTREENK